MVRPIPGAFSEGFNINVLPHVTAIGNICIELQSSDNKKTVVPMRLANNNKSIWRKQNLKIEVEHLLDQQHATCIVSSMKMKTRARKEWEFNDTLNSVVASNNNLVQ